MTYQANTLEAFHDFTLLDPDNLDAAISSQRSTGPLAPGRGGALLLRVDQRTGGFIYGPDGIVPDPSSLWAVNPFSLQIGWVSWADRKKAGEIMAPIGQMPECPNNGLEWKQQISFEMEAIAGEDKGEIVALSNSSNGALACWDELLKNIAARPNVDYASAVCKLDIHHYFLNKWNKDIYEPRLIVVDWMDASNGQRLSTSDDDIPFEDVKSEAPAEPVQEPAASASPVQARARRRSRSND